VSSDFYSTRKPIEFLSLEPNFLNFVKEESSSIARNYSAEVELLSDRNLRLAHKRFLALYKGFQGAFLDPGTPDEFKLAAALCFSIRRARPVVVVHPVSSWNAAIAEGKVYEVLAKGEGSPTLRSSVPEIKAGLKPYKKFLDFADEVIAFEIGLRVSHYFAVQRYFGLHPEEPEENELMVMNTFKAKIPDNFDNDILLTLRDHTNGPFGLYLLYQSCFLAAPRIH
jgi:hypothetical protein